MDDNQNIQQNTSNAGQPMDPNAGNTPQPFSNPVPQNNGGFSGYVDPNAQMAGQQAAANQGGYVDPNTGQPIPPSQSMPPIGNTPPQGGLTNIMDKEVNVQDLVQNAGTYQQQSQQLFAGKPIPPHPNTVFDEQKFVHLLAHSISLTVNEKLKIFDAIPQLSQFQIDELIKIFEEEGQKFQELEKKHADEIAKLETQHANSAEAVAQRREEDEKRQKEEEQAMLLMQQLNQGSAANSGDYSSENKNAA